LTPTNIFLNLKLVEKCRQGFKNQRRQAMKRCVFIFLSLAIISLGFAQTISGTGAQKKYQYLGKLSSNSYDPDSVSNPYGRYGSPYGNTINNPYSPYGSPYSPTSVNNPYATGSSSPILIGADGKYLGRLNANQYDPESVSNPYGRYGSPYSPDSINNPYGKYGSPYSPYSVNNPYTTNAPKIYAPTGLSTLTLPGRKTNLLKWPDK
jgi:hypothetical protein